jgi:signal transduction histidine kinase
VIGNTPTTMPTHPDTASSGAAISATGAAPLAAPALHAPDAGTALPPLEVVRAYLIGWVPLFLVYMIANETDGDWSRGFRLWPAIDGTLRGVGPAFLLLIPVWAYTGWIERRQFSVWRLLANHLGMAIVFASAWHAAIYAWLWLFYSPQAAEKAWNNWFIWQSMWGMMLYWAVAGGCTAYRAVQRARVETAASAQAQALLARTELAALRNKLNPHFLFNTLHSIIALTRKDPARAEHALLMFSDMLRHVLDTEKTGQDQVPLQQELDFTRAYLDLEALRLGDRLTVDWQIDPDALGWAVPALSVQPLVENSIKHAFNPRSAPGRLLIRARVDDDGQTLRVDIVDDGPGSHIGQRAAENGQGPSQGLGLATVSRRIALEYGPPSGLQIVSQPGQGFAAHLTLRARP